jgi:hypothetical protein
VLKTALDLMRFFPLKDINFDISPDVVKLYLHSLPNPSSRTMALGSSQPLTEMSTRNLPVG